MVVVAANTGAAELHGFDLSRHAVPLDAIVAGGPPKDGIPALTDPATVSGEAATYLRAEDRVLGVIRHGQARAYPLRILNWHEVVNDIVGGEPVAVTYCPLCGTGMVFRAGAPTARMTFGVSGLLYNSDVLLYDHATESLWSQLKMEAIAGPRTGERLTWLPVRHTTWAAWRAAHPHTEVLALGTGYRRAYDRDPYAGYEDTPGTVFPISHTDPRLPLKAWVLGVVFNGHAKAYPLQALPDGRVLDDTVGGQPTRVHYHAAARSAWVTDRAGTALPSVQAYWFAWVAFYPNTALYAGWESR